MNERFHRISHMQRHLGRMQHRIIEARVRSLGIHPSQHILLMRLSDMGRFPSQAQIAEELDISPASVARTLKQERPDKVRSGCVVVCTAGTADIPVAEEAAQTAEFFGAHVERLYDVGVSGIHRLLDKVDLLQQANCVVTAAGMEGALASVIGGLVRNPVIAVPTSVGYGASFHGLSALLTMINSCANCVSVVNIDNGYGAGIIATQINRLACK